MQQQKLCLKWNNHTLNLLSVLETFQQKDILVDVTLSCEGHNIKAHKMVLSACSPYFQNIFLENPCQHPIVIINGMKYEDITAILNFMYKGEVNVSHDGLSSFLQAAEALKVKGLAEVCGEKKSPGSGNQEPEQSEQTRPQRTETPTAKRRNRNRKRSLSDSNRSDDETAPRKHKGPNSPEVHELSGDESYTGDMSSNGQNSRVPQNVYSRSHQSSSNITADEMDDEYEVEPSKMLEQTLTTDNANSASSDNSLRIERIMGNATEMESSNLHEPESPPDIKPIIEYGESSAGPSEGTMMVYNEQSQPGPSNMQDGSLLHDNSHTQGAGLFRISNVFSIPDKSKKPMRKCETIQLLKEFKEDPVFTCESNKSDIFKKETQKDYNALKQKRENLKCLNSSKQLLVFNEKGRLRGIEVHKGMIPKDAAKTIEFHSSEFEPLEDTNSTECEYLGTFPVQSSFAANSSVSKFPQNFFAHQPSYNQTDRKMTQSHPQFTACGNAPTRNPRGRPRGSRRGRGGVSRKSARASTKEKYLSNPNLAINKPGSHRKASPCSVTLEKKSYTQVFEEVHMSHGNNSSTPRPERNMKKTSASEMLMLQRKIKSISTSYEIQSVNQKSAKKAVNKIRFGKSLSKKNFRNSPADREIYGPELLPPGWDSAVVMRKSGKSAGQVDVYFITPEGKRLRSKIDVAAYISENSLPYHPEEFCFRKSAYNPINAITYK